MTDTAHKPVLIVIAGPNGSGKTTITSQILHHEWMENAVYVNPDQIANEMFGDWNSIDDQEARLLFRLVEGSLYKQYTDNIPEWAGTVVTTND